MKLLQTTHEAFVASFAIFIFLRRVYVRPLSSFLVSAWMDDERYIARAKRPAKPHPGDGKNHKQK